MDIYEVVRAVLASVGIVFVLLLVSAFVGLWRQYRQEKRNLEIARRKHLENLHDRVRELERLAVNLRGEFAEVRRQVSGGRFG